MAWAKTFYHGPATSVTVNAEDYGECQDILIKWEPTGPTTMDQNFVQTGGNGTFEAKAMMAGTDTLTMLEAIIAAGSRITIVVTTVLATYTIADILLTYGYSGELNDPNKTTTFNLSTTKWTATPDAFVVIADV